MKRLLFFLYGLICYVIFFGTLLYMIGFIENVTAFAFAEPLNGLYFNTLDMGDRAVPMALALVINLGLIGLFGIQHSVMARKSFKDAWTKIVPWPIERSTYVLIASLILLAMCVFWQPIDYVLWDVRGEMLGNVLMTISLLGAGLLVLSTFMIDHFDLFGLRQVYLYAIGREITPLPFKKPGLYKVVRHPIYFSFLLLFWFAPMMTAGHLLFAGGFTVYILVGIYYEERDLIRTFGDKYREYRKSVPKVLPLPKLGSGRKEEGQTANVRD